jgi:hypothetical protein
VVAVVDFVVTAVVDLVVVIVVVVVVLVFWVWVDVETVVVVDVVHDAITRVAMSNKLKSSQYTVPFHFLPPLFFKNITGSQFKCEKNNAIFVVENGRRFDLISSTVSPCFSISLYTVYFLKPGHSSRPPLGLPEARSLIFKLYLARIAFPSPGGLSPTASISASTMIFTSS